MSCSTCLHSRQTFKTVRGQTLSENKSTSWVAKWEKNRRKLLNLHALFIRRKECGITGCFEKIQKMVYKRRYSERSKEKKNYIHSWWGNMSRIMVSLKRWFESKQVRKEPGWIRQAVHLVQHPALALANQLLRFMPHLRHVDTSSMWTLWKKVHRNVYGGVGVTHIYKTLPVP